MNLIISKLIKLNQNQFLFKQNPIWVFEIFYLRRYNVENIQK